MSDHILTIIGFIVVVVIGIKQRNVGIVWFIALLVAILLLAAAVTFVL